MHPDKADRIITCDKLVTMEEKEEDDKGKNCIAIKADTIMCVGTHE